MSYALLSISCLWVFRYTLYMHIHFVCSGNTNRSRMAEAYLRSKNIPGVIVSSSGTHAVNNQNGKLSRYAKRVLASSGILSYASRSWTQTTKEILESVDVVIFMAQHHYEFCRDKLGVVPARYEIWGIIDIATGWRDRWLWLGSKKVSEDAGIFQEIKKRVDQLIAAHLTPNPSPSSMARGNAASHS